MPDNDDFEKEYEDLLNQELEEDQPKDDIDISEEISKDDSDDSDDSDGDGTKVFNSHFGDVTKVPFITYIKQFNDNITGDIKKLNDFKTYNSAWISLLSTKQRLLEDKHILANSYNKLNTVYTAQKGKAYEDILKHYKITVKQKDDKLALVKKITANVEQKMKTLSDQMKYIDGSIGTIESVMHNAKYLIEINKALGPAGPIY